MISNGGMIATYIRSVAVAPSDPRIVYAGADIAGVFKSTNRGETWSACVGTRSKREFQRDAPLHTCLHKAKWQMDTSGLAQSNPPAACEFLQVRDGSIRKGLPILFGFSSGE